MVNTIPARVRAASGKDVFGGEKRGIAGEAIRESTLTQVRLFARLVREHRLKTHVVGVGGIFTARHVRQFLDAGCHAVQLATAAMLDPAVALRLRREWSPATQPRQ
jgi:dihydroorotate dehydrogenase (NAD+) catalytic subunit